MLPTMNACTSAVMEKWMGPIEQGHPIDVHKEFSNLTADIIARTAFGSSYADGERVFELQHEQQIIMDKLLLTPYFPGSRYRYYLGIWGKKNGFRCLCTMVLISTLCFFFNMDRFNNIHFMLLMHFNGPHFCIWCTELSSQVYSDRIEPESMEDQP